MLLEKSDLSTGGKFNFFEVEQINFLIQLIN